MERKNIEVLTNYYKTHWGISIKLALLVIILAILVLLGWAFDIKILNQPIPNAAAMNPFTAICFILEGISLILLTDKSPKNTRRITGFILAMLALIIATIILGGIISDSHIRIDSWLFRNKMNSNVDGFSLNFMAPNTALNFIITSITLILMDWQTNKKRVPSQYLALIVGFISIISILGYLYHVEAFYSIQKYFPMAIHTAIGFLIITFAILLTYSDKGFMSQFSGSQLGALIARKLIPAVLIIPIVLGFVRLYAEKKGYISDELGVGLLVFSNIVIFILIIWVSVHELNIKDEERREAEKTLLENNAFLDTVLENIPNMLFVKDAKDLKFIRFNRAGQKILGYKESDLIGKNDYDFFPKEQADFFVSKDQEIIKNGVLQEIKEERISTTNGDRWLHTKKIPVYKKDGVPQFIVGISEDITEQRKAEELLQQTLNELSDYKHALDESAIVAITDQKGIITQVNDNFCEISKFSREELIGQDHRIINSGYHTKAFIHNLWVTITNGKVWTGELKNKSKDGTYYWVKTTIVPFLNEKGKPYQYVAIRADITEQKLLEDEIKQFNLELEQNVKARTQELSESENRFRNLFENAPESIFVIDLESLKFVKTNKNASKLLKFSDEEFFEKGPLDISSEFQLDNSSSSEKAKEYFEKTMLGKKVTFEWMFCDANRKNILCEVHLALLPNTDHPIIYASVIDITERNEIQEKLKQQYKKLAFQNEEIEKRIKELDIANKELQKTNNELDRFVYSTSHDLRSPLKSLLGLTDLIKEDIDEENKVQLMQMDMMKNSIVKLDNFIEDILLYSRNARTEVAQEDINFEETLQGIIKEHKYMDGARRTTLKVEIQQDFKFVSDKGRVNVVLNNLISNAIKYSDPLKENPFVNIHIESSKEHAIISIEDNGIGIDTKHKVKVFDMFHRATRTSTGSGLGLYIVKETLDKLNGSINMESELNKGTKFIVMLPNKHKSLN